MIASTLVTNYPKKSIITGGASGIGEATAVVFANAGAHMVVIAGIQDELGHRVVESIGTQRCTYVQCDVADEYQVKHLAASTVNAYGQLDIMFSNADIMSPAHQPIVDHNFSELDTIFAVNVRGMAACVKHAARAMVEKRVRGSIVCTASMSGSHGANYLTGYVMSKHAVVGLMRAASVQLAARGIRVNSVSPTALGMPTTWEFHGMSKEKMQECYKQYARLEGVVSTPYHVAEAVLFLASNDSEFITGHDLKVDGGFKPW